MLWIQFAILLAAILIGSRMKGIGLGVMGMVGMLIFILIFHMKPGDPPIEVMLIILSVVSAAATLQAAGGMDYLVRLAETILRKNPSHIVFLGPLVTYFFTLFAGTAHINYSILPIIAEVSTKKRIRPERAMSISVISSHLAITASPVSAATATLLGIVRDGGFQLIDILKVCIPATIIGTIVGTISVLKMGKDLDKDPEFQERMKDPEFVKRLDQSSESTAPLKPGAKLSVALFGIGVLLIILFGSFPQLLPNFRETENFVPNFAVGADGSIRMAAMIEIIMLTVSAFIILLTKTSTASVAKASLFSSAAQATLSVFGVVWMSATFMDNHVVAIEAALGSMVRDFPWTFSFALFIFSMLAFSQAATTKALMPLGVSLGIVPPHLIAMFPAANGDFFLPGYPTLLAAIQFDPTGSTHIGKYLLNHSFMRPGIVAIATSVAAGFILAGILL
ncbi:anaerobic C4-dicarboxylate transporter [Pseudoflavitalea sp. G-6-1-2]|uniref:anaerobic C4-dicarboxylate transporter family protein n=1 Tax=Pseudoflavitalea sp. G-6-1-2 TaxID=2728841 RepID=UPI00146EA260|nr:anaerobic C4-dicarboxylate transporter [Pseudoflavitalea sp. G-6-1-2]NML24066.1 anaerobic C4-dicarboxylate transporter [Pseudoflavitalea sp. G-6-1-2]